MALKSVGCVVYGSQIVFCTNQVGCALGFGLPPLIVPDVTDPTDESQFDVIRRGFRILLYGGAAIMTTDLIIVALCKFHIFIV